MRCYTINIFGECQSKANSRQIVFIKGSPRVIKSKRALAFQKAIDEQVPKRELLEGHLRADIKIFYKDRRPDLDASLVLDGLQDKWYKNDRQIICINCERYLDKELPRVQVTVTEVQWDEWEPKNNVHILAQ